MGIEYNAIRAIMISKLAGAALDKTITIGRQGLYENPKKITKLLAKFGVKIDASVLSEKYAEKLLLALGAKEISSIDYADYEGATFIHDMNKPIDSIHKNKYNLVFDGGSLEHIFNFPIAIKNCMEMVSLGGYFISITMCNNFSGHGFYQFSPELFFRTFSLENGFEIKGIFISEKHTWYKAKDPAVINERVTFRNNSETYMIVLAKRNNINEVLLSTPLQSDYVDLWGSDKSGEKEKIIRKIIRKGEQIYNGLFVKYNKRFFDKINL
jgi:hypothetical protein